MDLNLYKVKFDDLDFSFHCLRRMKKRGISFEEIKQVIDSPTRILPQLNNGNRFIYRNSSISVLVARNDSSFVAVSTWKTSHSYVKSKLRSKKNKTRRQNNFANKMKRLKHGGKTNNKRS